MESRAEPPDAARRPPRAVIFDIGRVIVQVRPERVLEALPATGSARDGQQVWSAIQQDPRWLDWQEGRMDAREWHRHLTRKWNVSVSFEDFCSSWNAALDPETILSDSLFEQLSARCRLAVLSNTDPLHSARLDTRFAFLRHFPVRIYSCRVGASKPTPAIYRAALDAVGVLPGDALYIDDIAEYTHAAREVGMDAVRFVSPAQLFAELAKRGLPVE